MKNIFIPTRSGSDWQRLLAKPKLHWKKGASAMAAAACWEAASPNLPQEIQSVLGDSACPELSNLELLLALPEWQVPLPGGNTHSQTDVLAICANESGLCIIAVEAKVLEDFGGTVGAKRFKPSDGQSDRLDYLETVLGVGRLDDSIRYQLVHRTVSAVLTARRFHGNSAVMLVHAFGTPADRRADFDAFATALGAEAVTANVYKVPRFRGVTLHLAWCEGDPRFLSVELPESADVLTLLPRVSSPA